MWKRRDDQVLDLCGDMLSFFEGSVGGLVFGKVVQCRRRWGVGALFARLDLVLVGEQAAGRGWAWNAGLKKCEM